jgi:prophage tail gpP-like protein
MAIRIKIDGTFYDNVQNLTLDLVFDAIASTFSFEAFFDPDDPAHRRLFRPLSYHDVAIYEDKKVILTGTALAGRYASTLTGSSSVPVSGYSKTGVLGDCNIPKNQYPLEVNSKSLIEICTALCEPFGISVEVQSDVKEDAEKLYENSTAEASQAIADYLTDLATQRNIVLSHNAAGNLLLTRPKKDRSSIATYREGMPSTEIALEVNGQGMHSEINVLREATIGSDIEGDGTVKNPMVSKDRPGTKEQTKGDAGDTGKTAQSVFASELANINLTITSDRWEWYNGRIISMLRPNEYVTVIAKSCFLSRPSNWFVRAVALSETPEGRTATLSCVIPETFNGEEPKSMFT